MRLLVSVAAIVCFGVSDPCRATEREAAIVGRLNAFVSAAALGSHHDLLASEPHVAGTPGDERTIERLAERFAAMGLDVEIHRFHPYLARPIEASLEIVGDDADGKRPAGGRRGVLALDLRERDLLEDPTTAHPDLTWGWNAFSGSGEVEANVVYANYGTAEDFARLREWGVEVRGRIVLARYGGNYRGFKAKFAEEAGAAGLVIYTDPADGGFVRGPVWPHGGWANDACIQRGSLATTAAPGDVLTPGVEATVDAPRLDPASVGLPTIPVQPIGYAAAERILRRMKGPAVVDESWKGGLPLDYRLEGGPDLVLRLVVRQERFVGTTANVVATLRGAKRPEEIVVVGCHHDAWGFGAADPLAGTIVLLESARAFAELAEQGERPDRSIVFAAWGAEEFGIIGSTEWVEGRIGDLAERAIAYINLDMAAMGDRFHASSAPSLRAAIERAAERAVDPFNERPVIERWTAGRPDGAPSVGDLGGGSDHVAFWCHAGIPSCALGAGGAPGTSYHSNYDTVAWYRSVVGDDYRSATLVTRATNALVLELANGPLRPDDPAGLVEDAVRLLEAIERRAPEPARPGIARVATRFAALRPRATAATARLERIRRDPQLATEADLALLNGALMALRSAWIDSAGLPDRPWFRNLYAATDPRSGYAASMLPLLADAVAAGDLAQVEAACARYEQVASELDSILAVVSAD